MSVVQLFSPDPLNSQPSNLFLFIPITFDPFTVRILNQLSKIFPTILSRISPSTSSILLSFINATHLHQFHSPFQSPNLDNASRNAAILASASERFFLSTSTTSGFAFCIKRSLDNFLSTEIRKPSKYAMSFSMASR